MIKVDHLCKSYGSVEAVKDLSFEIDEGHVYGFLGPNGAGKSTTMNIMTGCLSASSGSVSIGGHDVFDEPEKAKSLVGYLPEHPPLYVNETPEEYLKFVGQAKGLKGSVLDEQIERVTELAGVEPVSEKLISTLSKGYKQRVGIAQALLGDPKVVILDEPTVGLDPIQIIEIRDLIKDLGKHHTVVFSSHILSEVQAICDKVMIISNGRLVAFTDTQKIGQLQTGASPGVILVAKASAEKIGPIANGNKDWISQISWDEESGGYISVRISSDLKDLKKLGEKAFFAFAKANIPVCEIRPAAADLEDVFLELTRTQEE